MTKPLLREGLPPVPDRIRRLPRDARGYPVPWFVAWIDGEPDFRVIGEAKIVDALRFRKCWVCGDKLGRHGAFTIGPMCAVNRTSAEPPSHRECAVFSAQACPFLTLPKAQRRQANMPEEAQQPAGFMLERNPGVAMVWVSAKWQPFKANAGGRGVLFNIGEPTQVYYFTEGRNSTRFEVEESIRTGLPALRELAEKDPQPGALAHLERMVKQAEKYLPPATVIHA